jgi:hypothetical protein
MDYLAQCRCEISLPLISITRLLPPTTRYTRLIIHARGLLYFTNYHIHDYKTSRSIPRPYRFATARQGGIYRPRSAVHGPSALTNQTWKKDSKKWQRAVKKWQRAVKKQLRVKTQYSKKVYPEEYANIVQLVTKQHLHSTTTYLWQKAGYLRTWKKTLYPSSS